MPSAQRVRSHDFSIEGLVGFDMQCASVGVVGAGAVAQQAVKLMRAFGCDVRFLNPFHVSNPFAVSAFHAVTGGTTGSTPRTVKDEDAVIGGQTKDTASPAPSAAAATGEADHTAANSKPAAGRHRRPSLSLPTLLSSSDVILVHCASDAKGLISAEAIASLKPGAMLLTARASLVDLDAALEAVKSGALGYFGALDVGFPLTCRVSPSLSEVLDMPKDCNAVQIKAAFRKLALQWHPDKHEGESAEEVDYAARVFKRIRIAYQVLSDPDERSRLDEKGSISRGKGDEGRVKPFHEYYSINTPDGYTRGGCFVGTRRYDPMVGATDARGSICAAEKMSRKQIKDHEEAIRLKGPDEAKRLLAPGQSSTSDQYTQYWKKQEEKRQEGKGMKESSANNDTFFGKKQHGAGVRMIAQTRYMPLEVEHRDEIQKELMRGAVGPMLKLGHGDDLNTIGDKTDTTNETLCEFNVHRDGPNPKAIAGRGLLK